MTEHFASDEPLSIIEEEARAMAVCFGAAAPDEAASSLVDRILLRLGGAHVYLPKRSARSRKKTHEEIIRRFNGTNLFELARAYGISPRHLRRIISAERGKP
ncbi:Mor transcription activator family protein [Variovorax paradoxus]|uniref:Mor transcription activator family protein n=1 Tax=Variovorax paradoxus TaxID=34073 RepID=UPI003ECEC93D